MKEHIESAIERSMEFQEEFNDALWSSGRGTDASCKRAARVLKKWITWADEMQNTGLLNMRTIDYLTAQLNRHVARYTQFCGRFVKKRRRG